MNKIDIHEDRETNIANSVKLMNRVIKLERKIYGAVDLTLIEEMRLDGILRDYANELSYTYKRMSGKMYFTGGAL